MNQEKKDKASKALLHLADPVDSLNQAVEILLGVLGNHKKRIRNLEDKGLPLTKIVEKNLLSLN